ncbi:MAG TPA: diaminopimelate decarboxylase [Polyangiales bacterium]|nr:diaminopimelate decarboxylase [Polyangiales bacterium]
MSEQQIPASNYFVLQRDQLHAERVPLARIAEEIGTPAYVYSRAAFEDAFRSIDAALADVPHMIAYAVKANSNLGVLSHLARLGSGADIVSGGELLRATRAGFAPSQIVFSGVGKTDVEIASALRQGIRSLHVESAQEIDAIEAVARELSVVAPISLRINPDVDAATHPYISTGLHSSKFGIEIDGARALLPRILGSQHLQLDGIACHIGSMVLSPEPISDAVSIVAQFACECVRAGARLHTIDAGGGWPILYGNEERDMQSHAVFGRAIIDGLRRGGADALGITLIVEPGRSIVGDAGVLLTRVLYIKEQAGKRFVIVDAAMTELIRPALYRSYHAVVPVKHVAGALQTPADVVGPVCESADFFAQERPLPPLARGDLLAIRGAGAYSAAMGSNYNSRPLAAEVLVDGDRFHIVRMRQSLDDLIRNERDV